MQELTRYFWRGWMNEWIPSLNARKKWFQERKIFQIDDVVWLVSPEN